MVVNHEKPDGDIIEIRRGAGGDVFGEVGFTSAAQRTATVEAVGDVTVFRINAEESKKALRLYPNIASKIYRNISIILGGRLAEATEQLK